MEYDYVVIGSGSAGSIIASRLSENPNNTVLLLEGGPDYQNFDEIPEDIKLGYATGTHLAIYEHHDWGHTGLVGDYDEVKDREIRLPRGKITGGSSSINGQIFLRGLTHDFELWNQKGLNQWKYEDVLPYFNKLENDLDFSDDFHGSDGPILAQRFPEKEWTEPQKLFFDACINEGYPMAKDFNLPDATGVGPFPCNNYQGIRMSTAIGYLSDARHRLNLTIRSNCYVTKLVVNNQQIQGVDVESNGEQFRVYGNKVILSAGTISSPHILLLSGIGPEDELKKHGIQQTINLPGVGKNLRDHPMNYVKMGVKDIKQLDTSKPMLQVGLRYSSSSAPEMPDDMILYMNSYASEGDYRDILFDREKNHNSELTGIQIAVLLYLATSQGSVTLKSSNPHDKPNVTLNLLKSELDVKRMAEGIRKADEIMHNSKLSDFVTQRQSPSDEILSDEEKFHSWLRRSTLTGNHMTSSCSMGIESNEMAVVDQNCKVYGIDNLYIADASVMPDAVRANTNVTTMMVAERVSDLLSKL
tara:strand:- start:110 stop:1693 length:1584 start_codon:yes stop_codon:yes gene_type:complete